MDVLKKVPVREQEPKVRATNFEEVCLGYNKEEAMEEAGRCINCKNAKCIEGCPVSINIPKFISEVKEDVFVALRANRYRLVNWKDLWQTMHWKTTSNRRRQSILTDIKWLLSVPVRQALPVQETLQN